jgi:hypothetical protein
MDRCAPALALLLGSATESPLESDSAHRTSGTSREPLTHQHAISVGRDGLPRR